jgi:SAM-dependent methyltransferase
MSESICPACVQGALKFKAQRGSLVVDQCVVCGLLVGAPDLSKPIQTSPVHFQRLTDQFETLSASFAGLLERRMTTYRSFRPSVDSVLEIGPGFGTTIEAFRGQGCSWVGMEYDAGMADKMQRQGFPVVQGDFSAVSPNELLIELGHPEGFDLVFASQVFEHVTRPAAFLNNAWACLKPGGLLHLDVPNNDGLTARLRKANRRASGFGEVVPPHHLFAYGKDGMQRCLEQTGFSVKHVGAVRYDHPTWGLAHACIDQRKKFKAVWRVTGVGSLGGNLTIVGQKTGDSKLLV